MVVDDDNNRIAACEQHERLRIHRCVLVTPRWDGLTFKDSNFGRDTLKVTHFERGTLGAKTSTIKLTATGKRKDEFKAAVGQYWHRHQVMRAQQQQAADALVMAGAGAASAGTAAPVTMQTDDATGEASSVNRPPA
jgi:hypothetical protein